MKNTILLFILTTVLQFISIKNIAQAPPDLRTAKNFVLFSTVGAVDNTGITHLIGDVGTNSGDISGFGNVNSVMRNTDTVTGQAALDLQAAWFYLDTLTSTATIAPALGNGDTLLPGVYNILSAGSLVSVLNLDAQGNPNAVFIFKFGGAFDPAANSSIKLLNGAVACNVFWKAEGAIGVGALADIKGTLIAHNGAITMGAGSKLVGRALSTTGAVSVNGTTAALPLGCGTPVLNGPSAPMLGAAQCFALFTANGIINNTDTSRVTGDIGSNTDSTKNFNPLLVTGIIHVAPDAATVQSAADLTKAYTYLDTIPYDIELLYPAQFGSDLTLTAHTYRMNAAAVLTDTVILDASGNANAIFVIQVNGALSTTTHSNVKLINGAQAKNVYWKVQGLVTINDYSKFSGTIMGQNAIAVNKGAAVAGMALTNSGNVTTMQNDINKGSLGCNVIPVKLISFDGRCNSKKSLLQWTATAINNDIFSIERSADQTSWSQIGTVKVMVNSESAHIYSFTDKQSDAGAYYRLKFIGINGNKLYSNIIRIESCTGGSADKASIYPNPSKGKFSLLYSGDKSKIRSIKIIGANGQVVHQSSKFETDFDLSEYPAGIYLMQINLPSKILNQKIIINKD